MDQKKKRRCVDWLTGRPVARRHIQGKMGYYQIGNDRTAIDDGDDISDIPVKVRDIRINPSKRVAEHFFPEELSPLSCLVPDPVQLHPATEMSKSTEATKSEWDYGLQYDYAPTRRHTNSWPRTTPSPRATTRTVGTQNAKMVVIKAKKPKNQNQNECNEKGGKGNMAKQRSGGGGYVSRLQRYDKQMHMYLREAKNSGFLCCIDGLKGCRSPQQDHNSNKKFED